MEFTTLVWTDFGAFALAAVLTIASAFFARAAPREKSPKALYEDKDGAATEETQKQFSTRTQTIIATFCAFAGFAISLTDGLLRHVAYQQTKQELVGGWAHLATWTFVVLQRLQLLREKRPVAVFRLSLCEAFTFVALAVSYVMTLDHLFQASPTTQSRADVNLKALAIVNLSLSVFGVVADLMVPRRPQLFHKGRPVDDQWTVSAAGRFSYSWPYPLVKLAAKGKQIEYDDLPSMDHFTRSRDLYNSYNAAKERFGGSMLKLLAISHITSLITQYSIIGVDSFLSTAPQLAMYKILRLLEMRDGGEDITNRAIFWVLVLGAGILVQGFLNNWMWWINYASFWVPLNAQLSALIYAKAMRRKDVKGALDKEKEKDKKGKDGKDDQTAPPTDLEEAESGQAEAVPVKEEPEEDAEASLQKSRQGVINLIGVDTRRIANFATLNAFFFRSFMRLSVYFTFLGLLVGWLPLVVGIAVQLLFLPVNIYFSKLYTKTQDSLMKVRDKKVAVVNEALGGIRQIKFSALERQWHKKIMKVREEELHHLWKTFLWDVILIGLWLMGPVVLSLMVISVYAMLHGGLPASIAFTTISLLSQIEATLSFLPELTTNMLDAYVSLKRIQEYLEGPERVQQTKPGKQVAFYNADITWPTNSEDPKETEETFALRNINLEFPVGELSVISGETGSGKSLLLNAILGEVDILAGTVQVPEAPPLQDRHDEAANASNWIVPHALSFISQQPWIENATVKNNILFGLPFDEKRYRAVISACALDKDLEILTDGEETEIGANGINLSGGQRWRMTLARALYSRAGLLVMDDIFSAVDAHVGKHIFEHALTGELATGRTRILVTHHVGLVIPATKYEVQLGDGKILHAGLVDKTRKEQVEASLDEAKEGDNLLERVSSKLSKHSTDPDGANVGKTTDPVPGDVDAGAAKAPKAKPRKFIEDEQRERGRVKWRIYKIYLDACGGWFFWIAVMFIYVSFQGLVLGRSWVLKLWTETYTTESPNSLRSWYSDTDMFRVQEAGFHAKHPVTINDANDSLKFYLALYFGFAIAICIEGTFRYYWLFTGSIKASRKLFESLTYAVLRAPLRWLDTMPVGRILNRFTSDFNQTDGGQTYSLGFALSNIMILFGVVIAAVIVSPYIIICAAVLFGICAYYAVYFVTTARQTKRLESTAKSPIFEHFSASLAGVSTLRAFDKAEVYIDTMFERIDVLSRTTYFQWLLNRWLSWRLNVVGALFAIIVAGIIISIKGMNASLGGFSLGFTLQYTDSILYTLRALTAAELGMNATERIIEYSEIEIEPEKGEDAPAHWPAKGELEVKNLVVGYADDLPSVLNGLSFSVNPNERVGVVGRTGAGKSSLTLALFRFLKAREGTIHIDGVDISKVKLHDLRSRIAIIPQDPVLFSGTVKSNLDPFDDHEEQSLKDALERVHLVKSAQTSAVHSSAASTSAGEGSSDSGTATLTPKNRVLNLTTAISESGLNLSQGQRQLLCLARAIVSRPKIMVLDEATSAVDKVTDALIQRSIREEFRDSTLVVIAHRLSTIADFDRILVMGDGKVAEYGTPKELYEKEDGVFRGMVESSGEKEALEEIILGPK